MASASRGQMTLNLAPGPKLWHLHLSTWAGLSIGATHTYARLDPGTAGDDGRNDYDEIRVERYLTEEEVRLRNERDKAFVWEVDFPTQGFDTAEDATAAALVIFDAVKDDGDSLSTYSLHEDGTLLAGPEGNPHLSPHHFGGDCRSRLVTIVVRRGDDGWVYVGEEED